MTGMSNASSNYPELCLEENHLELRDKEHYPLQFVPLFNVNGRRLKEPLTFKQSYDRLVKEIDKVLTRHTFHKFFIETESFLSEEIPSQFMIYYNEKQEEEKNANIVPLCLFKENLLPEAQRSTGIDTYVNALYNQLFLHYKFNENNNKFRSEPRSWEQKYHKSNNIVLSIKLKCLSHAIDTKPEADRMVYPSGVEHIQLPMLRSSFNGNIRDMLLRLENYQTFTDMYRALQVHVSNILPIIRTDFQWKIGKSTTRQKRDITFDSGDIDTWDLTNINQCRKRIEDYFPNLIVVCAITSDTVPRDLQVNIGRSMWLKNKTEYSIQELLALALRQALKQYFDFNVSPKYACMPVTYCPSDNPGKPSKGISTIGVLYIAAERLSDES